MVLPSTGSHRMHQNQSRSGGGGIPDRSYAHLGASTQQGKRGLRLGQAPEPHSAAFSTAWVDSPEYTGILDASHEPSRN